MNTEVSFQELKQGIQELRELQRENAIQLDSQIKNSDRRMKETENKFNKFVRLFEDQWSNLVESLVEGCLVELLKSKNIDVHRTSTRVHGIYKDQQYEFDIIAHNEREIVIVEVKSSLNVSKVKDFLKELSQVKTWLHEYKDYKIYGAVAYLRANEASPKFAEKNGLFVIKATGDSAVLANAPGFIPNVW